MNKDEAIKRCNQLIKVEHANWIGISNQIAIGNVLNYIEDLEKCLNYYKLGDTAEEFEELFGNTPIDDIEKIKKYVFQNYIPKQAILDKIEEKKKRIDKMHPASDCVIIDDLENQIEVLQELLNKGEVKC